MKVKVISLPYIFHVLYVLCFTRPIYQVRVCRTIGPLVHNCIYFIYNLSNFYTTQFTSLLFGSKRKLKRVKDFKVTCNSHTIEHTPSVKYLGLNIDNLLSGEFVVNNILSKVNARLKFMYRHKKVYP